MDDHPKTTDRPAWLELERIVPPEEVEYVTNLSWDSIQRHHGNKVVRLSPRRVGMKLKHALAIASGK